MKEPNGEQGVKPLKRKVRALKTLIVRAGIANSTREAQEMLAAGEICHGDTDDPATWAHGDGKRKPDEPSTLGTLMLDQDTRVVHRSKCPKCSRRPLVFTKKDRKPAKSWVMHPLVQKTEDRDCSLSHSDILHPLLITQEDLELWILRRREFQEIDESLAVALSGSIDVEDGVHTAELVPVRNEDGSTHLKLLVR